MIDKKMKDKDIGKKFAKDLKQVQDQYIDYPYPLRNPEDEKTRIILVGNFYLGEINHWVFGGKESFQDNFRILVAGAGTGDAVICYAEQLKNTNAEIVYLDFSKASMAIAQERAKIRGLKNIKWVNDSILNIPNLKLGTFDYINCIGVLHHLESPELGLKVLKDSLSTKGGMDLMVYAHYGRTGVYHIQTLMQMVNNVVTSRTEEVKNGWAVMTSLPATNWYNLGSNSSSDHILFGDVGMYDLFLHKQDRAYTIPQLYDFIAEAGLNFVDFNDPYNRLILRLENYIKDPALLEELKKRDIIDQQAMCEIIAGSIVKHQFFVSNQKSSIASFEDLENVPYFYNAKSVVKDIYGYLERNHSAISVNFPLQYQTLGDVTVTLPVTSFTKYLFKYMIDETMSFREIFDAAMTDMGKKIEDKLLIEQVKNTLTILHNAGVLLLRNKNVGPFPMLSN